MERIIILYFLIGFQALFSTPLPYDLESDPDSFILSLKQIHIKGTPNAFNPALIKHKEKLLLVFRYFDKVDNSDGHFAYVWLDEDFNPLCCAKKLIIPQVQKIPIRMQDMRLIKIKNQLWGVFSGYVRRGKPLIRRIYLTQLHIEGDRVRAEVAQPLIDAPPLSLQVIEKNWVPFEYQENMLLSYTIDPHVVLRPILPENLSELLDGSSTPIEWEWGEVRGGTPALKIEGDRYLSIFHSSKNMKSKQSGGSLICHYFMGGYTFDSEPPFTVKSVSKKPLMAKNFYEGPVYKTWKPLRCVFPCGLVDEGKTVLVSYGRNDNEVWITRIDKEGLLQSLQDL